MRDIMGGYLVNFAVYTMAMIGLIFFALMIYKKFSGEGILGRKSEFLSVEDTIGIAPRKNLYVVRAGNERFLIAGDIDKTTLIAKLDENNTSSKVANFDTQFTKIEKTTKITEDLPDITDIRNYTINQSTKATSSSDVLKRLAKKINE